MNTFTAVGKVAQVEKKHTQTGKDFYNFVLLIPVSGGAGKELELRKYCTLWPFLNDKRVSCLVEGSWIVASGTIEGYPINKNGKEFVNEKFKISEVGQVAPSVNAIGDKYNATNDQDVPF